MASFERPPGFGSSFTVADARAAGWTRAQIASARLDRPFHGVRAVRAEGEEADAAERHLARAHRYRQVMDAEAFYSHVTAAVAWDAWLPAGFIHDDIDVAVLTPARNVRGRGVRGHEVHPRLVNVVVHPAHGFRVASPASTWAMLGGVLRHPYDLIAAGDAFVRVPQHPSDPPATTTVDQLSASAAAGRRVGIVALREALPCIRTGSSSRMETWTRMTLIGGGLPEPSLAFDVHDAAGRFIGRVDMGYPHLKIAVEYEGEHHLRDPTQWRRDILRYERLAEAGWTVIRVTKGDLLTAPQSVVARVRRALARS